MDSTQLEQVKASINWYLAMGATPVLLRGRSRVPLRGTRADSCSTDVTEILDYVTKGNNVAVLPGDNLVIVDIDLHDDCNGEEDLKKMGIVLPSTRMVATPRNGWHAYYKAPGCKLHKRLPQYPGIEVFTLKKDHLLIPGSQGMNCESLREYTLYRDAPLAELPQAFIDLYHDDRPEVVEDWEAGYAPGEEPIERVERIVMDIRNDDLHYDDWFKVGAAIHHATGGSDEGLALFDRWSRRSSKYGLKKSPEKVWYSVTTDRHDPVTMATLVTMKNQQGTSFDDLDQEEKARLVTPEKVVTAAPAAKVKAPGAIPRSGQGFLPGIAGELEQWVLSSSMRNDPRGARIAALHCLSLMIRNKVVVGETKVTMNLFTVYVAPSASGKDTVQKAINEFAEKAGGGEMTEGIMSWAPSGSGLIREVSTTRWGLWLLDEAGKYIGLSRGRDGGHKAETIAAAMSLFTSAGGTLAKRTYAKSRDNTDRVRKPYLSICAMSATETMIESLEGSTMIQDGFLNRSIPIITTKKPPFFEDQRCFGLLPASIMDWSRGMLAELAQIDVETPQMIPLDDDALGAWKAQRLAWDAMPGAIYGRAAENSLKLAGLVAFGLEDQRVTLPLMEWALTVVGEAYETFMKEFLAHSGDNSEEAQMQEVVIEKFKAALTRPLPAKWRKPQHETMQKQGALPESVLHRNLARKDSRLVKVAIETLIASEILQRVSQGEDSKSSTTYLVLQEH